MAKGQVQMECDCSARPRAIAPLCRTLAVVAVLICGTAVSADETPRTGVIDDADVVNGSAQTQLNSLLLELEQKTGAQLKVWTIRSSNGRDLYTLAIETARKWQLGQKGKNNGALVVIAVKDRKWRVVTGEGIEDVLPDLLCDRITQEYFVPFFRKGDYGQGILLGTSAMAQIIAGKYKVELSGARGFPVPSRPLKVKDPAGASCSGVFVLMIVIMVLVSGLAARRRRYAYGRWGGSGLGSALFWGTVLGNMRGGGGWSGGSSWGGGGSSGGFGGGGGGSFGGGGSGGSW